MEFLLDHTNVNVTLLPALTDTMCMFSPQASSLLKILDESLPSLSHSHVFDHAHSYVHAHSHARAYTLDSGNTTQVEGVNKLLTT